MAAPEPARNVVVSLDGTRGITVEEFDRIADDGSDEIDEFIDWSKGYRDGRAPGTARVSLDLPLDLLERLHAEADRRGLARDDLLAEWVAERARGLGPSPARGQAAE